MPWNGWLVNSTALELEMEMWSRSKDVAVYAALAVCGHCLVDLVAEITVGLRATFQGSLGRL